MTARFPFAAYPAAVLAFVAGLWGWHASEWSSSAQSRRQHGIAVVVNDDIITGYDIEQRARFLGLGAVGEQAKRIVRDQATMQALQKEVILANKGKPKEVLIAIMRQRVQARALAALLPGLRKKAKEELIEDRLKLYGAKKLGIVVSDEEVKRYITQVASRNKMTYEQFGQHLKKMGVNVSTMGEKFRAQKAWHGLIGRRYAAQVSVTHRDVDRALSAAAIAGGKDTVELQIQRISLGVSGKDEGQTALTRRYSEAEVLRRRFGGCKTMQGLAASVGESKFVDMKYVKPASIGEPMRSLLLSAKDNDILPPVTTSDSVDLYAVCGRRSIKGSDKQRAKTERELQSNALKRLAERHLRDLKQEASIEYK